MELSDHAVNSSQKLDSLFLALADPTRRAILARLAQGEATVNELAAPFAMSQPAISKHLRVLERAELIVVAPDRQRRPRRIQPKRLSDARDWIENLRVAFQANYERLDGVLAALQQEPKSSEN